MMLRIVQLEDDCIKVQVEVKTSGGEFRYENIFKPAESEAPEKAVIFETDLDEK